MARTIRSRKMKGMRLQKYVVKTLLDAFPDLTANDIRSIPSSVPTEDIWLSEAAKRVVPYSIECKNVERLNIWQALEQSEQANRKDTPLLIFKRNNSDVYACLKLDELIRLIGEIKDLKTNLIREINLREERK